LKLVKFSILLLLLTGTFMVRGESDTTSAKLSDFKLPQYDKEGKLIFILYGKGGNSAGINIFLENVLIDLVKSNIKDIDLVKDFQDLKIYPLQESTSNIIAFWKDKPHCTAIITAPLAVFDRSSRTVKGDREIKFRSLFLDIDGEGFDGDYDSKTLHIRKNVRMTVRTQFADMGGSARKSGVGAEDIEKQTNENISK